MFGHEVERHVCVRYAECVKEFMGDGDAFFDARPQFVLTRCGLLTGCNDHITGQIGSSNDLRCHGKTVNDPAGEADCNGGLGAMVLV